MDEARHQANVDRQVAPLTPVMLKLGQGREGGGAALDADECRLVLDSLHDYMRRMRSELYDSYMAAG